MQDNKLVYNCKTCRHVTDVDRICSKCDGVRYYSPATKEAEDRYWASVDDMVRDAFNKVTEDIRKERGD